MVEFKCPARDDYTDDKNPIAQVYGYVRHIQSGKAKDRQGRPINVPVQMPCYAYIVCDLMPTLKTQAENHDFTIRPDAQGYVHYNKTLGLYTEIVSFEALIDYAKKRNARLFEELGLDRG